MYVLISQLLINFFFQFRPKGIDYILNFKNPNNNHVNEFIIDQLENLINQFYSNFFTFINIWNNRIFIRPTIGYLHSLI